jgi:ribA/ribD-fused uncharacterized protein
VSRALNGHSHIEEIAFYRANEKPYGAFSNLYRRPIVFEGIEFPTAEHAYQAGKARKKEVRDWLLKAPTPSLLAMAAHGLYTWDIVPDWSLTKYDRMRKVLYAKFSQHEDLKQVLLNTGNARLVENGTVPNAVHKTWGESRGQIMGQSKTPMAGTSPAMTWRECRLSITGRRPDRYGKCETIPSG